VSIDVSRLLVQLNNTGLQNKDNPLYQFLSFLIRSLKDINTNITDIQNSTSISGPVSIGPTQIIQFYEENFDTDIISSPTPTSSTGTITVQVSGETPTGAVDGSNKLFTTSSTYISGYLNVYLNGVRQSVTVDYTETSSNSFTFVVAPTIDDILRVDYIVSAGISGVTGPTGPTGAQGPIGPVMIVEDGLDGETFIIPSPPSSGSAGKVVQVVNTETGAMATGTTIIPFDDTIPQNTEGTQFMSLAITPTSATNNLKIEVRIFATVTGTTWMIAALFQDTTANALATVAAFTSTSTAGSPIVLTHYMAAGTTSATTFKVRVGPNAAATVTFNGQSGARIFGGVAASSITITEIVP
jgi:hypothetical protein